LISWIKGEIISSWLQNQKLFLLVNCQGIGYEIQILSKVETDLNKKNIILWIEHIKRDDLEYLFGFIQKEERDFFRDLLKVRGIGPQIGMSLLNKYSIIEVKKSIINQNKDLISSVPGIGKKMTERILLELKNKITDKDIELNKFFNKNDKEEIKIIFKDIDIALRSLEYPVKDIKNTITLLMNDFSKRNPEKLNKNNISFENILKKAIQLLDDNDSKFG
tara:strand:- start:955 stop:1614 length:660 start_codon:yes stop_codon:yes gene_type:complete